jgi:two-component system response regulator HydG
VGPGFTTEAREALATYDWPGNLRELRNVIERASILAGAGPITAEEVLIPERKTRRIAETSPARSPGPGESSTLSEQEERIIRDALEKAGGNKSKAARILGITRRALYGRLERYGIETEGSSGVAD